MEAVRNGERGTTTVETAIGISLFLGILLFGNDIILFANTYSRLQSSLATSARWGSLGQVLEDPVRGIPLSRSESIQLYASRAANSLGLQLLPDNFTICPQNRPECGAGQNSAGAPGEFFFIHSELNYTFLFIQYRFLIRAEAIGRNEQYV